MAKPSSLKEQITELVSKEKSYKYKETWFMIWQNVLPSGGLRLTQQGFIILGTELEIEFWTVHLEDKTLTDLLTLEKKLECPYYLFPKNLAVFSEKTAVELSLYANNIDIWLNR